MFTFTLGPIAIHFFFFTRFVRKKKKLNAGMLGGLFEANRISFYFL
jgi:hypothetical protein